MTVLAASLKGGARFPPRAIIRCSGTSASQGGKGFVVVGGVGTRGREPAGQSCGEQEAGGEVFGPVLPAGGKPGRVRGAGFGWKTAPVPSGGTPQPCWPCTQSATVWSSSCAGGDGHLQAESGVRQGETG